LHVDAIHEQQVQIASRSLTASHVKSPCPGVSVREALSLIRHRHGDEREDSPDRGTLVSVGGDAVAGCTSVYGFE
jgi:hypothetical protein